MLASVVAVSGFVSHVRVPGTNAVRPSMSLMDAFSSPGTGATIDAVELYAATTFCGLATTAVLAPITLGARASSAAVELQNDGDICELIEPTPSDMHQPVYMDMDDEEEDW